MYETNDLDYERLEFLRKNTMLGPIALLRIAKAKKDADRFRQWYKEKEGELLEADYTIADQLEYEMRFNAYQNSVGPLWSKHGDGLDLRDFTELVMDQAMNRGTKRL